MDRRTITLVVSLFVLIIIGMFTFAYLSKSEKSVVKDVVPAAVNVPYPNITRIDAKHYYSNGKHTFVGEIEMPTPCDLVDVSSSVAESMPEQISLNFKVINNADSCIETVTMQRFMVEALASANAVISAEFMGRKVELNLIPAAPGETPADFELFIKG